jgi:hypothetical protein
VFFMASKLERKLLKVLEIIALEGLVSGYQLKNRLDSHLSASQRWLSMLESSGEIKIYKSQSRPIKRKLYGLTFIGFLYALSIPKVEKNFSKAVQTIMTYSDDDEITRNDFQKAVQDSKSLQQIKELYLSLADALYELYDIENLPDAKIIFLAKELAVINEPEKMFSIFKYLIPRMSSVRSDAETYCRNAKIFCKSLEMK